ncbi:BamA/TamA family outer membrane protein [Motiliproteus sp. SC1-56]|uniref:BamA/TamA family outer membrane protein n=1 Tax=Motiliproteus sp. SC1-56 TaxID=2799565 RepID=UPI001A8EDF80|nr:BamA/TamA family outer membrane protein [Motiliproteus sp. SC1-56]
MGLNFGLGGIWSGYHQPQMTFGLTGFGGEVSEAIGGGVWDYRVPYSDRWYLSLYGMAGYYPDQRAYTAVRDEFVSDRSYPGSNDSSDSQFIEADGHSNFWDLKLEYTLPIGAGARQGAFEYRMKKGLLASSPSGGISWNPFESGITTLVLRQFNRYQSYETGEREVDGAVHALEIGLLYDNTDFSLNPSTGSSQYLAVSHDAGWLESKQQWSFIQAEWSKYLPMGETDGARQRVLAFNLWAAYSPSWRVSSNADGEHKVSDAPPFNEGATLGGFYRMRGYDQNRFHDKAALYGTAEYRYTLRYNPIPQIDWLRFTQVRWFQLVGFVEAGRVAPHFSLGDFDGDIKTDYGVSLRALAGTTVVRMDLAHSDEATNLWVMVGHPF